MERFHPCTLQCRQSRKFAFLVFLNATCEVCACFLVHALEPVHINLYVKKLRLVFLAVKFMNCFFKEVSRIEWRTMLSGPGGQYSINRFSVSHVMLGNISVWKLVAHLFISCNIVVVSIRKCYLSVPTRFLVFYYYLFKHYCFGIVQFIILCEYLNSISLRLRA